MKADNWHSIRLQYSLYYYHIAPWLKVIPRERFLFLRTEDLAHEPSLTMSKVWRFLQLHDLPITEAMFQNANLMAKGIKVPSQTKQLLDKFYQPYNELLAHLLRDMRYSIQVLFFMLSVMLFISSIMYLHCSIWGFLPDPVVEHIWLLVLCDVMKWWHTIMLFEVFGFTEGCSVLFPAPSELL